MGYYYKKEEYLEVKKQLEGEYAVAYKKAAAYIHASNLYGLENEESCLLQIMDDFLTAQKEGKPLYKIIGPDLRRFCDKMMKAESERLAFGLVYWLHTIPVAYLLISVMAVLETFLFSKEKASWDTLQFIKINGNIILFFGIIFLFYVVKKLLAVAFFHYTKILNMVSIAVFALTMGIASIALETGKNLIPVTISVPVSLFLILNIVSIIAAGVSIYYNSKHKIRYKVVHKEEELDEIEKRTCPVCKKLHDCDYPACPYCRHKYTDEEPY
ncbi:DUF1048 domain-containing protein [Anaerocolumna xylanovorans]|uniref:DNA-binding ferritin-like protein (Dps family) n=1 Tax=Anaerocolumna xylanovorans DSM 12503 TaxID=1121345 RepID=A0A1M7Y4V4_9FIRM|nr:DUF1048 domain-containing protein [Anaerocolumna xylanovorans]SHO47323.1 DNA-binding ferritin-like protein (Dps family) [Anaerocolumna xylanovorans DSM 12503]